jgi:hypothetical protein
MRKAILILALLTPTWVWAQSTTVSGTVIDTDGQPWFNGSVVASFVPAPGTNLGQYTWSGGAFNPGVSITAIIASNGSYSMSVPSNTSIVPALSHWTLTVNSGTTSLNTTTLTFTVTGPTMTQNFAPAGIRLSAGPGVVAYLDLEVNAQVGQGYFQLNSTPGTAVSRICQVVTAGVCTTWSNVGSSSSGTFTSLNVTGTATLTGQVLCKNFENVRCVDSTNSAGWAGTDVGGWLNSACSDLPAYGGKVELAPTPDGRFYVTATALTCDTVLGKPVLIEGLGPGAVGIRYTATTGSFFTDDPGLGGNFTRPGSPPFTTGSGSYYGHGLKNLMLFGPGCLTNCQQVSTNTAIAITWGPTNGTEGGVFEGLDIQEWHIGLLAGNGPILTPHLQHSVIQDEDNMIVYPASAMGNENDSFGPALKIGSDQVAMPTNCVMMDSGSIVYWYNVSFDSCQFEQSAGQNFFYAPHFENPAGTPKGCSTNPWFLLTRGRASFFGGDILNDCAGAGTLGVDLFRVGSGTGNAEYLKMYGMMVTNNNFTNLTQLITHAGAAQVIADIQSNTSSTGPWTNGIVFCNSCTGPEIIFPTTTGVAGSSSYTSMLFSKGETIGNNVCYNALDTTGSSPVCIAKLDASNNVNFISNDTANYFFATGGGSVSPGAGLTSSLGAAGTPWTSFWLGTAATNNFKFQPAATSASRIVSMSDPGGNVNLQFRSGTTTTGDSAKFDVNGNLVDSGAPAIGFTSINVTPVTVSANVSTDQNGMAVTVTAGALNSVSRTLLIQLAGVYSTPAASTTTLTHKLKLCTVSGCGSGTVITLASWTTSALGGVQATNNPYNCTVNSSTQTAGATAAFEAHGNLTIDLAALAAAAESVFADNNTATVGTIDSTVQLFLQHTIAFGTASASNTATDRQMIVDTVD